MFISSGYSAHTRNSGTEQHHHAPDVFVSGRNLGAPRLAQTDQRRLALELAPGQSVQLDRVVADRPFAARADHLSPTLEHVVAAGCADRRGVAGVDRTVDLAHVRGRT